MDPTIMMLTFRQAALELERQAAEARAAHRMLVARRHALTTRLRTTVSTRLRGLVPAPEPSCCPA